MELFNSVWGEKFPNYIKMAEYFYKRRIMGRTKEYTGYALRYPSWQVQWQNKWKKTNIALIRGVTVEYDWLEVMQDAGVIGEGFGAGRIWFLDDHIGDSFVYDADKVGYKGALPKGLYMIDGITGMFLDYMPGEVTSVTVAMMIIRNAIKYGLPATIGLENSRSMRNLKLDSVINSLYGDETLAWYRDNSGDWFHELFPRAKSPIARNLPNIPRSPFKARLERMFQDIKRHDSWYFPLTYQGGGRDPVQLRVSNTPKQPLQIYSEENYTNSIIKYLSGEYLQASRPGMFKGFEKRTGLRPTVENVWKYYGGHDNAGTGIVIDESKFALSMYWLSQMDVITPIVSREVKAYPGRVNCKVDGREYLFLDSRIAAYEGEKITIVFIPNMIDSKYQAGNYAALFAKNRHGVEYINICKDTMVREVAEIKPSRERAIQVRKEMKAIEGTYEVINTVPRYELIAKKGQTKIAEETVVIQKENKMELDSDLQFLQDL